jgi:hypothetical protein
MTLLFIINRTHVSRLGETHKTVTEQKSLTLHQATGNSQAQGDKTERQFLLSDKTERQVMVSNDLTNAPVFTTNCLLRILIYSKTSRPSGWPVFAAVWD